MKRLLIALCLALPACGFQPVYAPSGGASLSEGYVTVEPIAGRSGYMLRRALQQELAIGLPGVATSASLKVKLQEDLTRLAFKPDGAASRSSIIAKGNYVLDVNGTAVRGSVDSETSFTVPDQPYGDIAAQSSASDRAMRQLARKIVDDLRLQLSASD